MAAEQIEDDTDTGAVEQARRLFASRGPYSAFEVWERDRLVHKETR